MKPDHRMLATLLCLAAAGGCGGCGGGDAGDGGDAAAAATARPAATAAVAATRQAAAAPVKVRLKPSHHSGVTGTATFVPAGDGVKVTLALDKPIRGPLLAHVHTGPCSHEPTMTKPRIWVGLTDVVDGRSQTTEDLATLQEFEAEPTSVNVHDPDHANRPLVCGDLPRGSTR
jgi:hypothetical protein